MKKIFKALEKCIIGFVVAWIISNKSSFISKPFYNVFNIFNIKNESLQISIVSLIVTSTIVILQHCFLYFISFFKPINIEINTDRNRIQFVPESENLYNSKKNEFEFVVTPGGYLTMFILKKCKLQLVLFFNPDYMNVGLENDSKWNFNNKLENSEFLECNSKVYYYVLEKYSIEGKEKSIYNTSVMLEMVPRLMKDRKSSLSYDIKGKFSKLIKILCKVRLCEFECKSEKVK